MGNIKLIYDKDNAYRMVFTDNGLRWWRLGHTHGSLSNHDLVKLINIFELADTQGVSLDDIYNNLKNQLPMNIKED